MLICCSWVSFAWLFFLLVYYVLVHFNRTVYLFFELIYTVCTALRIYGRTVQCFICQDSSVRWAVPLTHYRWLLCYMRLCLQLGYCQLYSLGSNCFCQKLVIEKFLTGSVLLNRFIKGQMQQYISYALNATGAVLPKQQGQSLILF